MCAVHPPRPHQRITLRMTSANQLTLLRLILVPVFLILVTYGYIGYALGCFVLAAVTDTLDGLIARRFGQKTALGTLLDPMADKLLLTSAFVILSLQSTGLQIRMPLWLTITVISRDLLLVVGVLVFNLTVERRIFLPSPLGKVTTASQLLLVLAVLVANAWESTIPGLNWLMYVVLVLTVLSGFQYTVRGTRLVSSQSAD